MYLARLRIICREYDYLCILYLLYALYLFTIYTQMPIREQFCFLPSTANFSFLCNQPSYPQKYLVLFLTVTPDFSTFPHDTSNDHVLVTFLRYNSKHLIKIKKSSHLTPTLTPKKPKEIQVQINLTDALNQHFWNIKFDVRVIHQFLQVE